MLFSFYLRGQNSPIHDLYFLQQTLDFFTNDALEFWIIKLTTLSQFFLTQIISLSFVLSSKFHWWNWFVFSKLHSNTFFHKLMGLCTTFPQNDQSRESLQFSERNLPNNVVYGKQSTKFYTINKNIFKSCLLNKGCA